MEKSREDWRVRIEAFVAILAGAKAALWAYQHGNDMDAAMESLKDAIGDANVELLEKHLRPGPTPWECPRCHRINAPHAEHCDCPPKT